MSLLDRAPAPRGGVSELWGAVARIGIVLAFAAICALISRAAMGPPLF